MKAFSGIDPAPLHEMDKQRWEGHHSICQFIRDMYHMTDDPKFKLKARIAMGMTKALHERLKAYKAMAEKESNNVADRG